MNIGISLQRVVLSGIFARELLILHEAKGTPTALMPEVVALRAVELADAILRHLNASSPKRSV